MIILTYAYLDFVFAVFITEGTPIIVTLVVSALTPGTVYCFNLEC